MPASMVSDRPSVMFSSGEQATERSKWMDCLLRVYRVGYRLMIVLAYCDAVDHHTK
jgi:hypothetical protein